MLYVDSASFENEVLKSDVPVFVDFFATWCGPCKMLMPILQSISKEVGDKVKMCKLDVDQSQDIAAKYGVRSIPTLIMFKDGKEVAKQVGSLPKPALVDFINSNI